MQMMRMAKDVEEELKEEDDDDKSYGRKGTNDKVGRNDWARSQMRNQSGSSYQDTTRSGNKSWVKPVQKTGSTGSTEKWKGIRSIH